jgi:Ca2+-binding RTX toxin-like protein
MQGVMDYHKVEAGDRPFHPGRGGNHRSDRNDDDTVRFNVSKDDAVAKELGAGDDAVRVRAEEAGQVRLTFTSAEVGNGNPNDSNTMANQDGGLAVRLQAEDGADALTGPESRFDDEGISFESRTRGLTFDVRDLVAGTERGDRFEVVSLGTQDGDRINERGERESYYINAGMGDDKITGGKADDFLVGGAGNDTLKGGRGDDSLLGGAGDDTAVFDASRHGADSIDLGAGNDVALIGARHGGQIRLTFTSAEVGNASVNDANTMTNQDGGLAVRFQAEDGADGLSGPLSRFDDEGITFVATTPGLTFDVRDLVAGTQRGSLFEVVRLGTEAGDSLDSVQAERPYYINAGMGDDTVTGGNANDFLVGGAGNDSISGGTGNDSLLGGGGGDAFLFNAPPDAATNVDSIIDFSAADDTIQLDSAVFTGLAEGALDMSVFALATAVEEVDDRIIYDQGTGGLFFDANGGTRDDMVAFATLTPPSPATPPVLTAADFFIV